MSWVNSFYPNATWRKLLFDVRISPGFAVAHLQFHKVRIRLVGMVPGLHTSMAGILSRRSDPNGTEG